MTTCGAQLEHSTESYGPAKSALVIWTREDYSALNAEFVTLPPFSTLVFYFDPSANLQGNLESRIPHP